MTKLHRRFRIGLLFLLAIGTLLVSCSSEDSADIATSDTTATSDTAVSTTAQVVTDPTPSNTTLPDPVARISVTVGVDSSPDRVEEVALGQEVALTLSNPDAADEFHLHGYDLGGGETAMGEAKTFSFTATEAGEFELESHVTGDVLVVVKVS